MRNLPLHDGTQGVEGRVLDPESVTPSGLAVITVSQEAFRSAVHITFDAYSHRPSLIEK